MTQKRATMSLEGHSEVVPFSTLLADIQALAPSVPFPTGWNTVNGQPFIVPLPDGKPIEIPESWKLPPEMRGNV